MCFRGLTLLPLLTERVNQGHGGYKHFAPPEQEPRYNRKGLFLQSQIDQQKLKEKKVLSVIYCSLLMEETC